MIDSDKTYLFFTLGGPTLIDSWALLVTISESPVCIVKIKQCVDVDGIFNIYATPRAKMHFSFSLSLIEMVD